MTAASHWCSSGRVYSCVWQRQIRKSSVAAKEGASPHRAHGLSPTSRPLRLLVCLYEILKYERHLPMLWHWGAGRGKRKKENTLVLKSKQTDRHTDWSRFFSNKTSDALFIHMRLASTLCSFTHSWRLRGIESHPRQASGSYIGFFGVDWKKKQINLKLDKTLT